MNFRPPLFRACLFLSSLVSVACASQSGAVARLSVSGTRILDPSGNTILLRGWNWGRWGSVQPQDGSDNVLQGANVVRIPLRWWGQWGDASIDSRSDASPGHIDPAHLAQLDQTLLEASNSHLWVDLFVDSNCGQASVTNDTADVCGTGNDGKPANFMNDPATKQKFVELWQFLVARYKDKPYLGMYEILPEPNFTCTDSGCSDYSTAPTFYASIIPSIRALDARTPILVGPDGGYDVRQIATADIPNVSGLIYTGNFLDNAAAHPDWVSYATNFQSAKNVPVFIQQVGVRKSDTDAVTMATTLLTKLNANNLGWTWWTYREENSPSGQGYAPWYVNGSGAWVENPTWLTMITDEFH